MIHYINAKTPSTHDMKILEIGSWVGSSACLFAQYFKEVICVDPFIPIKNTITIKYDMKEVEEEFLKNISEHSNIMHLKNKSEDLINLKRKFEVVYIDGDHHYNQVMQDIDIAKKLATKYIAGHDFWKGKFDGVIKAVRMKLGQPDKVFPDTSWIKKVT